MANGTNTFIDFNRAEGLSSPGMTTGLFTPRPLSLQSINLTGGDIATPQRLTTAGTPQPNSQSQGLTFGMYNPNQNAAPNTLNTLLGGVMGGNSPGMEGINTLLRLLAPQAQEQLGAVRENIQSAVADPRATAQNVLTGLMDRLPAQAQQGINTAIGNVRDRVPQVREGVGNIFEQLPQMQNFEAIRNMFSGQFGGNAGSFNDILGRLLGRNRATSNTG